jgi:antitoxin ParD1/3/4
MSKNTSVALGDHFSTFVDRQIADGRYGNVSEVIRAGLRLLEEHGAKHKALQAAIQEGLDSGPPRAIDVDAFIRRKKASSRRE